MFDGFNRLVRGDRIKTGVQSIVTCQYNGDNLRTQKISRSSKDNYAPKVTNYVYDRQHVILETDDAGNTAVRYVHGINYIARIDASNKLSYYLFNGHGDVVQTVSEAGTVENQYDYDIFGNPTLTIEMYAASIRYAGEFYDAETGLYYLRARYYDPYIGRFISEDTYEGKINDPLSLNRYTYANNDPIMYVDPTGHAAKKNNATVLLKDVVKDGYGGSLYWDNKNKAVTIKINNQKVTIKADGKDAAMVNGRVVIKPETLDRYYNNNSVKVNKEVPVRYEISTTATAKEITTKVTTVVPTGQRYSSSPKVILNEYKPAEEIKKVVNEIVKNKEVSQSNFESVVNIIKFECMDNPECQATPLVPYESKSKSSGSPNFFLDSWNLMENGFNVLKDGVVSDFNKIVETNSTVPGAIDYWGFGSYSAAVGTFNPEKPLSLQHWSDSFQTATTLLAPLRSLLKFSGPTVKGMGKFLDAPATSNGTLNIGARGKPTEGAYNIDIDPKASGVHYGDATNLSNIKSGSQSKIIIENPYDYDPLNPEILRVLSQDGEVVITGSRSNMNKIVKTLDDKGLKIKGDRQEVPNDGSFKTTDGEDIKSKMLDQYTIIRK
ncbi:RHS repeat-associated core domain-containing protein [Cohnella cholangitidis]|uniref:RHS repeat-associated core domain-containing protein n=1 Tax=Cohnella cholangitidis TaxID=2598458 RepID=A0A7G5BZQ4_9BACL|nr:RHS repeat-associated core domain-containing protein [Cohnella cholangitidis]QMV42438.1 RHS repeat-associated core domain-containing protein [Cohnella cholangitidis]